MSGENNGYGDMVNQARPFQSNPLCRRTDQENDEKNRESWTYHASLTGQTAYLRRHGTGTGNGLPTGFLSPFLTSASQSRALGLRSLHDHTRGKLPQPIDRN